MFALMNNLNTPELIPSMVRINIHDDTEAITDQGRKISSILYRALFPPRNLHIKHIVKGR